MTREKILAAAYELAKKEGTGALSYKSVAEAAGVTPEEVHSEFENVKFLWAEVTYKRILDTAYEMVVGSGLQSLRRDLVAEAAGVSAGSVSWHFKGIGELREAIIGRAIEGEQLDIIAQGLATGSDTAKKAPKALQSKALKTLL